MIYNILIGIYMYIVYTKKQLAKLLSNSYLLSLRNCGLRVSTSLLMFTKCIRLYTLYMYIPSNLNNPNRNFHLLSFWILYSENRKPLGLFPERSLSTITLVYNYIYLFKWHEKLMVSRRNINRKRKEYCASNLTITMTAIIVLGPLTNF